MTVQLPLTITAPEVSPLRDASPLREKNGVVYTKPWVVDLILDLAGYDPEADLAAALAVEPAAGDGAFLVAMARRLAESCRLRGGSVLEAKDALVAYELDEASADGARAAVVDALVGLSVGRPDAEALARGWVRAGDYLLDAPALPAADFVVGNPPYIRLEDIDVAVASAYRAAYPTMRGRADIYVAFYEAALRQLAPGGVCAYICADRWMLNQYGAELRRLVTAGYAVETVVEMHHADPFESEVSAYPAVTVIRKGQQGAAVVASAGRGAELAGPGTLAAQLDSVRRAGNAAMHSPGVRATRTEAWFRGADPWPCVSPERLALLQRLEAEYHPLESEGTGTRVGIGVATGADEVFITTDPELVEPERLLPLAMASDALDGELRWSGRYLANPWDARGLVDLGRYPRLRAYFEAHRERLAGRHVGRKNAHAWYRTIDRVDHRLLPEPKLLIPDIKDRLAPVLDAGGHYPHHNLYYVSSAGWDHEVLGGLLLSDVAQFFVECYGVRMRGGYLRFQAQYLRRIRVPRPRDIPADQAAQLAAAFRAHDRARATRAALAVYGIDRLPGEGA